MESSTIMSLQAISDAVVSNLLAEYTRLYGRSKTMALLKKCQDNISLADSVVAEMTRAVEK